MARGTVVGEKVVSMAGTDEFRAGYDVAGLGKSETAKERGRFVWDPERKALVRAEDYRPPARALDAPIIADRWREGTKSTDGVDIGSRAKERLYMKATGVTHASDFKPDYTDRVRRSRESSEDKARREQIARIDYTIDKP